MEEGGGGMSKNPSFQFYPGDWLSSQRVSLLTLEEEGAYIRLLCYCWQHGNIPSDSVQLARLIGKGATVELAETVAMMFQPKRVKGGSALVHDRLDVMKEERAAWLEKSRLGGIRSGQARKKANETGEIEAKGGSSLVEDCLEPKGNTSTSTSTSINSPPFSENPTKKEVLAFADQIGLVAWKAEDWWLDMESKGWLAGKTEIRNWQAGLTRIRKYWEADGRPMAHPGRNGAASSRGSTPMPLWKRIEVLRQNIETHPGNKESTYYRQDNKKEKEDFIQLRKALKTLKEEERDAALSH